jgi:hypothetical protein
MPSSVRTTELEIDHRERVSITGETLRLLDAIGGVHFVSGVGEHGLEFTRHLHVIVDEEHELGVRHAPPSLSVAGASPSLPRGCSIVPT